jgi:preprotein translocase subunit SecE
VSIIKRVRDYLAEVIGELRKVTWVKRRELLTTTLVVIGFSTILAGFIFLFDFIFANLLRLILPH